MAENSSIFHVNIPRKKTLKGLKKFEKPKFNKENEKIDEDEGDPNLVTLGLFSDLNKKSELRVERKPNPIGSISKRTTNKSLDDSNSESEYEE